jgi:MYXO-CTERM domain-containing protein
VQLRFVAADENPARGGVEAAIDDVEITSNLPACYAPASPPADADSGCDCEVGGPSGRAGGAERGFWLIAALAVALRARSRRRLPSG